MAPRSRRIIKEPELKIYCRRCMKTKNPTDFWAACDKELDRNNYFSICRDCCNEIYESMFRSEHTLEKAIYRTCKILNIKYDESAIEALKKQIKTKSEEGVEVKAIFGTYKARLISVQHSGVSEHSGNDNLDLTFEPIITSPQTKNPMEDDEDGALDLKEFWGTNYEYEDYLFLEKELSEWKRTHKCDTKAELTLLKEICHKQLEIRKKRVEGASVASLVGELQKLMVTAAVDPNKASVANSGKGQEAFSLFVKTIEENEPADYYKDKKLFKDFDNINFYFEKYVTRPLKNFVTMSRDFNVSSDNSSKELDEFEENDENSTL